MSVTTAALLLSSATYLSAARSSILKRIAVSSATKGLSGCDHGATVYAGWAQVASSRPGPFRKDIIPTKLRWLVVQATVAGAKGTVSAAKVGGTTSTHTS